MFERDWTRLHPQNLGACTQHTSMYGSMGVYKKVVDENLAYNYTSEWVFGHENDVYRTHACMHACDSLVSMKSAPQAQIIQNILDLRVNKIGETSVFI